MKIKCLCGNVLRDQTDFVPFKARLIPDQDTDDLAGFAEKKIEQAPKHSPAGAIVLSAIFQHSRTLYQCRNCGRIYVDDPEGGDTMQVFRPETNDWKKVLASLQGESSKPWPTNLVANWDSVSGKGELWFDPAPADRGGYETFSDRTCLEGRYYSLLDSMRSAGHLQGARFGVSAAGKGIDDVHNWRPSSS